jgi:hypothetical protein
MSGITEPSIHASAVQTSGRRLTKAANATGKPVWLLSIPTVADVVSRPEPLDGACTARPFDNFAEDAVQP